MSYSIRQSIRSRRPTPTSGPEASTVQIDVESMDIDDVSLRVYDCAGQVIMGVRVYWLTPPELLSRDAYHDRAEQCRVSVFFRSAIRDVTYSIRFCPLLHQVAYTGLLQMFLTPRAVTLLVCNTDAFGQRDGYLSDGDQLDEDLDKLQELRVCDWLRSLSFRIPDSDVCVVATKCDLAGGKATDIAERVECAIRQWLKLWSDSEMTAVRIEPGVNLTSCVAAPSPEEAGGSVLAGRKGVGEPMWTCDWLEDMSDEPSPPSLLHRVIYNSKGDLRGAYSVIPRSWNIALTVLDAVQSGRQVKRRSSTNSEFLAPNESSVVNGTYVALCGSTFVDFLWLCRGVPFPFEKSLTNPPSLVTCTGIRWNRCARWYLRRKGHKAARDPPRQRSNGTRV